MISQESEEGLKAEFGRSTVQMSGELAMSDPALNIPEKNRGSSEHVTLPWKEPSC